MTKYVKTDYVPKDCDYLTAGKVYEVVGENGGRSQLADIVCDNGNTEKILYNGCAHLYGRPWTVWEE